MEEMSLLWSASIKFYSIAGEGKTRKAVNRYTAKRRPQGG